MVATLVSLPRDADGHMRLPGVSESVLDLDMAFRSTVPPEITTSGSTVDIDTSAGPARLRMQTPLVGPYQTAIALPSVDLSKVEAVVWRLALTQPATQFASTYYLGIENPPVGCTYRTVSSVRGIRTLTATPDTQEMHIVYPTGIGTRPTSLNIALVLLPRLKMAGMVVDDQEWGGASFTSMDVSGPAIPRFTVQGVSTEVRTMYVNRATLTVRR